MGEEFPKIIRELKKNIHEFEKDLRQKPLPYHEEMRSSFEDVLKRAKRTLGWAKKLFSNS